MSVRTMARVWADSKQGGTELLMLLAIADFADDDGNAYPAVGTLAKKCRMSPRNVNHLLVNLRNAGELEIRQNEGPKGTNRYRILLGAAGFVHSAPAPERAASRIEPLKPASSPTPEAHFTPEARFTLKPTSPTPEAGSSKPLKPASDEPSLNHQEPPNMSAPALKAPERSADGFAEFWAAWPVSTRKQDRKRCAEKWRRGGYGRRLAEILAHVEAMKQTKSWREGFEPAPLTYLNGERWGDGMPPPEKARLMGADEIFAPGWI